LTLYVDSSALVKRYVAEDGSEEVRMAMEEAAKWTCCRHGYIETVRAVGLRAGDLGAKRVRDDWLACNVIELDQVLAEDAARLALASGLRTLDALHLAAALTLPAESVTFATWDVDLHRAARKRGLTTLPATLD
jgi:predicted nucleic acid-binding protein